MPLMCSRCKNELKYLGSTKDGDAITDYWICIKGHKKKMRINAGKDTLARWLEEPPF